MLKEINMSKIMGFICNPERCVITLGEMSGNVWSCNH